MFLPFLVLFKIGPKTAYYFASVSFLLFVPVCICFQNERHTARQTSLMGVAMLLFAFSFCGEDIF